MLALQSNSVLRGFAPPVVTARGGVHGLIQRSDGAHVQYWVGSDIPIEINAERLLSAYRAWTAASKDGIPRLRDIVCSEASAAVNDTLLFLAVNGDYLVVSEGVDHIRHLGRDMRGRLLSEFDAPVSPVLKELYDQCLAAKSAIYSRFVSDLAPDSVYWEGLFVPLKADDGGNAMLVMNFNTPIENKAEILQMILDRSPVGMIAAVPPYGNGDSGDGRIVSINARAKEILKFDRVGGRVNYIRDLAPCIRKITGWTRMAMTTEGQKTHIQYRDKSGRIYAVTIEPLKRFVLFSITEAGNGKGAPSAGGQ
jgi:PAS domain-containing protein